MARMISSVRRSARALEMTKQDQITAGSQPIRVNWRRVQMMPWMTRPQKTMARPGSRIATR